MTYLIKSNPVHVWNPDGTKLEGEIPDAAARRSYVHRLEVPHFLNTRPNLGLVSVGHLSMIVPSAMSLQSGDEIEDEYGWKRMIIEVVERRTARGDWNGRAVDFILVRYF